MTAAMDLALWIQRYSWGVDLDASQIGTGEATVLRLPETTDRIPNMKIALEIRPGEGGDDAKMLVHDQASIYAAYAEASGLSFDIEDDAKG